MSDIEHAPIGAERHDRRPAGDRRIGLTGQPASPGIDRERRNLVLVLEANIEVIGHGSAPAMSCLQTHWRIPRPWLQAESSKTRIQATTARSFNKRKFS